MLQGVSFEDEGLTAQALCHVVARTRGGKAGRGLWERPSIQAPSGSPMAGCSPKTCRKRF